MTTTLNVSLLLHVLLFVCIFTLVLAQVTTAAGGPSKKDDVHLADAFSEISRSDNTVQDTSTEGFYVANTSTHDDLLRADAELYLNKLNITNLNNDSLPSANFSKVNASEDTVTMTPLVKTVNDSSFLHFVNVCDIMTDFRLESDPTNCSAYYLICSNPKTSDNNEKHGSTVTYTINKTCPTGMLYDSIDHECSKEAHCGAYECKQPDGFFPDHKNKAKFIHCFNGVPGRKLCEPKGTIFNSESRICEWIQEDLTMNLKLLRAFIWFLEFTSENDPPDKDGLIDSTKDYIIVIAVALSIPLLYLATIIILYYQFNGTKSHPKGVDDPIISDAEEFYRYYTRPTPLSTISGTGAFASDSAVRNRNRESDMHMATTEF